MSPGPAVIAVEIIHWEADTLGVAYRYAGGLRRERELTAEDLATLCRFEDEGKLAFADESLRARWRQLRDVARS